jgi:hypothetical protein
MDKNKEDSIKTLISTNNRTTKAKEDKKDK